MYLETTVARPSTEKGFHTMASTRDSKHASDESPSTAKIFSPLRLRRNASIPSICRGPGRSNSNGHQVDRFLRRDPGGVLQVGAGEGSIAVGLQDLLQQVTNVVFLGHYQNRRRVLGHGSDFLLCFGWHAIANALLLPPITLAGSTNLPPYRFVFGNLGSVREPSVEPSDKN
jgi:hypothetical protein